MIRLFPALVATCLAQPAAADMFRPWSMDRGNGGKVTLKSCSGATEAAPFGGGSFAPCIDIACDPGLGLILIMAIPTDGDPRDWPATLYAESRDKGSFTFRVAPETGMFPSAIVPAETLRPILEDLAGSVALSVLFRDPPYAGLNTLRGYPMDNAAAAIPEFLAACPLLNGSAAEPEPALPSFATDDKAEAEEPALPSFAPSAPADTAQPAPAAAGADPARTPPGFVAGMPLTFAPDPAAAPATPADDPGRFIALPAAALPDQTAETLVDALMATQKIDFAARYGGVPVVSGDLVVFTDGRLILSAVFCVAGKTGDQGCETWAMTTPGGGAPFAVSSRGLPSDRPLWVDLQAAGTDGWPDLMVQDAAGAWTRLGWTGTGYF